MAKNVLKLSVLLGVITILFVCLASTTHAAALPNFFTCLNPQGDLKITTNGTHGVPGTQQSYDGTDQIYTQTGQDTFSSSTVVQCLCPTNGQGVQTNWWNASNLTDSEINVLEAQGWIYIPDGSAWGLNPTPYLAQNTHYACTSGANGSSGTNESTNSTTANGSNGSSTNNASTSNTSGNTIQSVLGAFSQLGSTGNALSLYELFFIGLLTTFAAIILRRMK